MRWRWDQGRLDYFRFDNLRLSAGALHLLDGLQLDVSPDPLREPLEAATGLPFSPRGYSVWRNYARVYKAALLATKVGDRLACTEWCSELARRDANAPSVDDYLSHFARNFGYPSPAFEGYDHTIPKVYPVCALLKLLVAKAGNGDRYAVDLDEVFGKLIARSCTGFEDLTFYTTLTSRPYSPAGDEPRQVREFLRFVSQFSFLKWRTPDLWLDVIPGDAEALGKIASMATPVVRRLEQDSDAEVLALGRMSGSPFEAPELSGRLQEEDEEFVEGKKVRVTHLRSERSQRLRRAFFLSCRAPCKCDVCGLNPPRKYPWVTNILEIHHLLPLSSAVRVESSRTSLSDLVPICPNCHRAVHLYYRKWLDDNDASDFADAAQATAVYTEAKARVS